MTWFETSILVLVALVGWAFVARWLAEGPRAGSVPATIVWRMMRVYARLWHRLSIEHHEVIPNSRSPGPLIVVVNHTAGVDPVLVQAACPFEIRWMMARDMRLSWLEWFWDWLRIINVDRSGKDLLGPREAIRHLADGGVLGIFPEGGLERPPAQIMPFLGGVGLIIKRSKAPVLPIIIDGTPQVDPAWASLWTLSRSRLCIKPPIYYARTALGAEQITEDLRARYLTWTGWSANNTPAVFPAARGQGYVLPHRVS